MIGRLSILVCVFLMGMSAVRTQEKVDKEMPKKNPYFEKIASNNEGIHYEDVVKIDQSFKKYGHTAESYIGLFDKGIPEASDVQKIDINQDRKFYNVGMRAKYWVMSVTINKKDGTWHNLQQGKLKIQE